MDIDVNQLEDTQKYQLLYILDHSEITTFARAEFKSRNVFTIFYFAINAILLGSLGFWVAFDLFSGTVAWYDMLGGLCLGILVCFSVVILLHELLHVLAYKIVGAKETAIKADWEKFVFVAVAHRFVAGSKEFYFIALLPFTVFTIIFLLGLSLTSGFVFYMILGAAFMHTAACGGDFALVSYFWKNRYKKIITYDDVPEKKSYFYEVL